MGGGTQSSTTVQTTSRAPATPEERAVFREQAGLLSEQTRQARQTSEIMDQVLPLSTEFAEQQLSAVSSVIHNLFGVGTGGAISVTPEYESLQTQLSDLRRQRQDALGNVKQEFDLIGFGGEVRDHIAVDSAADLPQTWQDSLAGGWTLRDVTEQSAAYQPIKQFDQQIQELDSQRRELISSGGAIAQGEGGPPTPNQLLAQTLDEIMIQYATGERPLVSDDIRDEVDALFEREFEKGNEALVKAAQDVAATRGLNVTDSPVMHELIREQGRLARDIATAKVGTAIQLGESTRQFLGAQQQFQKTSDLSALGILTGVPVQPSATTFSQLSGGAQGAGLGLLGFMQSDRPTTTVGSVNTKSSGSFLDALTAGGRVLSGVGSAATGLGKLGIF